MPRFILSVIVPALAARDRHRLRRPAISSIIEPCRPWLSWVGKGSSVFSEREPLLKCTERFGPNLVAATRIDENSLCHSYHLHRRPSVHAPKGSAIRPTITRSAGFDNADIGGRRGQRNWPSPAFRCGHGAGRKRNRPGKRNPRPIIQGL